MDHIISIEKEASHGRKIIINISGGRNPQAIGALFGCYSRHEEVERIVYVTQEDQEIIDLQPYTRTEDMGFIHHSRLEITSAGMLAII